MVLRTFRALRSFCATSLVKLQILCNSPNFSRTFNTRFPLSLIAPFSLPPRSTMERFAGAANWNLEQSYEKKPRISKKSKKDREPTRLPIKTADGIIQRVEAPPSPSTTDFEASDSGDEAANTTKLADSLERTQLKEEEAQEPKPKVPEKQRILEAKEELARIATMVNEDPEENVSIARLG